MREYPNYSQFFLHGFGQREQLVVRLDHWTINVKLFLCLFDLCYKACY